MELWSHWQSLPIFWCLVTLLSFYLGQKVTSVSRNHPLLPPILTSLILLIGLLEFTNTSYKTYMEGGQYIGILLAPAVVLLAVPLFQFFRLIRRDWLRISFAIMAGSFTTVFVAVGLCEWLIDIDQITHSMLAKSVTTPVAITLSEQLGGVAALSSAFVIITGLFAALIIPIMFTFMRLNKPESMGVALGVCGHAIGTSRANELGSHCAAYSALAMSLTATLHAIMLPWLV